jgi:hypothetical protein
MSSPSPAVKCGTSLGAVQFVRYRAEDFSALSGVRINGVVMKRLKIVRGRAIVLS